MKQLGVVRDHEAVDASPPELGVAAVRYLYSETLSMGAPNFLFSVFREDVRGRKTVFDVEGHSDPLLSRHVDLGPIHWTDADDFSGAKAFQDQVHLHADLDSAASQWDLSFVLGDLQHAPFDGHVRGAIGAMSVLQLRRGPAHLSLAAFLEIGVEREGHAAEQGGCHLCVAELAILDSIDPRRHPAAADEGLVRLGLGVGGALHRGIVQPDV